MCDCDSAPKNVKMDTEPTTGVLIYGQICGIMCDSKRLEVSCDIEPRTN